VDAGLVGGVAGKRRWGSRTHINRKQEKKRGLAKKRGSWVRGEQKSGGNKKRCEKLTMTPGQKEGAQGEKGKSEYMGASSDSVGEAVMTCPCNGLQGAGKKTKRKRHWKMAGCGRLPRFSITLIVGKWRNTNNQKRRKE